jgi:hypothetical protein
MIGETVPEVVIIVMGAKKRLSESGKEMGLRVTDDGRFDRACGKTASMIVNLSREIVER